MWRKEGVRWTSTVTKPAQYTNPAHSSFLPVLFSWGTGECSCCLYWIPASTSSSTGPTQQSWFTVTAVLDIFDEALNQCQLSHQSGCKSSQSHHGRISEPICPERLQLLHLRAALCDPGSSVPPPLWHDTLTGAAPNTKGNTEGSHDYLLDHHPLSLRESWQEKCNMSSLPSRFLMVNIPAGHGHCSKVSPALFTIPLPGTQPTPHLPLSPLLSVDSQKPAVSFRDFKASFLCSPVFLLRRKLTAPSRFLRTCCTPNAEGTQRDTRLCWREGWWLGTATAALTKRDYVSEIFLLNIPQPDLSQLHFYFLMLQFQTWALIYRFRDFASSLFWYEAL